MFGQLFLKECHQTAKSLVYWAIVLVLVFDFTGQLGDMEIDGKPEPGQESYGMRQSHDPDLIMESTLGQLTEEYYRENYTTYPIGFYKNVTLNEREDVRIGRILEETTKIAGREEAGQVMEAWYLGHQEGEPLKVKPADGLTYDRFTELMDEADQILGGGSNYSKDYREKNAQVPMTYEEAMEEYNLLIEEDGLTGGYARLFSDYMVIFLGVLPVFLATVRGLRDRRAAMQELIYTRKCSSLTIVASRYLAMIVMLTLPVLAISVFPLSSCMNAAKAAGITADVLAFVKYTFGWLLPTIMIAAAVGMFLTELTDTAVAVLIQSAWWFIDVFTGVDTLDGGMYGFHLVPRHNTEFNWQGFHDGFAQLVLNRTVYAVSAILLVIFTALIYDQKRKGRLQIHGKVLADRKNKS